MKSVQTSVIVEGVRSKKDRSLSLTISTPELEPNEKVVFMELQGLNSLMTLKPLDEQVTEDIKIDKEAGEKSLSERLRNVLYIWYTKEGKTLSFEDFRRQKMEGIIERIKEKIDQYD